MRTQDLNIFGYIDKLIVSEDVDTKYEPYSKP